MSPRTYGMLSIVAVVVLETLGVLIARVAAGFSMPASFGMGLPGPVVLAGLCVLGWAQRPREGSSQA